MKPEDIPLLNKLIEQSKPNVFYPEVRLLLALLPIEDAQPRITFPPKQIKSETATDITLEQVKSDAVGVQDEVNTKESNTENPKPIEGKIPNDDSSGNFVGDDLWQKILDIAAEKANTISTFLSSSQYSDTNNVFTIYANSEFKKKRIESKRSVILSILPEGYELVISDKSKPNTVVDNILDIMGGGEIIKQ